VALICAGIVSMNVETVELAKVLRVEKFVNIRMISIW
jgi:hypothetical protein